MYLFLIYFTGGAKRNEFVDYFICVIIGALWGLGYLRCIELGVKMGIESRLATAMVIFVLTTILYEKGSWKFIKHKQGNN